MEQSIRWACQFFLYVYCTFAEAQSLNAIQSNSLQNLATGPAEAWNARLNLETHGYDQARAIATDDSGNIYVTGLSAIPPTAGDFTTVKYNFAGITQWSARYTNTGYDDPRAIAVDASGNVYVTGLALTSSSSSSYDYLTIKYNNNGIQQWAVRYNGPGSKYDAAIALAVDGEGNIYVTGSSFNTGTARDYATIKYNSKGEQQWVARYNHGNQNDEPSSLAIDRSGNIYVTGQSLEANKSHYATVKYNNAGVQQWVARYTGLQNDGNGAKALAVDSSGNVYVTGHSYRQLQKAFDYATIKYNSAGIEQWVARYDGPEDNDTPTALAIDDSGNVYVTGHSRGNGAGHYFATIKYNQAGTRQWLAQYKTGGGVTSTLAVDHDGNVYVTGHSLGTKTSYDYTAIKYNSKGIEQWVSRYDGNGYQDDTATDLVIDRSGNVYVTGYSIGGDKAQHYVTVKFDHNGIQQWAALYKWFENNNDQAFAVAIDDSDNVYVTGYTGGTALPPDYVTIKYNRSGIKQWVAHYDNTQASGSDIAKAIAVDRWGNVYVTGHSVGAGTSTDYATVKYDRNGITQWVARYNGGGNSGDGANAIAVDDAGNVFVTGFSATSSTLFYDYVTIKYNSDGVQQWIAYFDGSGNQEDSANAIAIDGNGNVYVTGRSVGAPNIMTYDDFATVKYNSAGIQQWVARYQKELYAFDESRSIAVDGSGNVYVGGYSDGTLVTVKYNSIGAQQWVGHYQGASFGSNTIKALALDDAGNVLVTGNCYGTGTGRDYVTIKYNNAGNRQWAVHYNGPGNADDFAVAVASDHLQNVYVTGYSVGAGTANDYATIRYSPAGEQQWVARYNGPANGSDAASALAVDRRGDVIVAGYSTGASTKADLTTIKYLSGNPTAGCFGEPLPAIAAFGKIEGGDNAHVDRMNYCFAGQAGDLLLSFQAYDIDSPNEVNVLLNGTKIAAVPVTANQQWSGDNFLLLPDSLARNKAANTLVFDNKQNPPNSLLWGVRQVSVQGCFRLPSPSAYGKIPNGDQNHADRLAYSFSGQAGDLQLSYEVFDIDNKNEVNISLNGIKIHDEAVTTNDNWSGARTLLLPDNLVKDDGLNLLVFDNTQNPPLKWNWGVKNVSVAATAFHAAALDLSKGERIFGDKIENVQFLFDGHAGIPERKEGNDEFVMNESAGISPAATTIARDSYLTIDFLTEQSIDYLLLYPEDNPQWLFSYRIEASLEGMNWRMLIDKTADPVQGMQLDVIHNTRARFLRISGTGYICDLAGIQEDDEEKHWQMRSELVKKAKPTELAIRELNFFQRRLKTNAETAPNSLPADFNLAQNFPNPFNPVTKIQFALPRAGKTKLILYNLRGELVKTLIDDEKAAGYYEVIFDATDLASGLYFYRLQAGDFLAIRKLIVAK